MHLFSPERVHLVGGDAGHCISPQQEGAIGTVLRGVNVGLADTQGIVVGVRAVQIKERKLL